MRNRLTGVLFLAGVFVSTNVEAAPITFNFTGTATASFVGGIATPAPLTGSYTFESATADADPGDPQDGIYAAITAFSLNVGGYVATGSAGTITVQNNALGADVYMVDLPVTTLLGGFAPLGPFQLTLRDNTGTAFSSDALPTSIDVAAFGSVRMFFVRYLSDCGAGCDAAGIFGGISSVSVSTAPAAVPEPGTFLLIGTGIAIALARRRRTR